MIKYETEHAEKLGLHLLDIAEHETKKEFTASNGIIIYFSGNTRDTHYRGDEKLLVLGNKALLPFRIKEDFDSVVCAINEYNQPDELDKIANVFSNFICYEVFKHMHVLGETIWKFDRDRKCAIDSAPRYVGFVGYVYKTKDDTYEIIDTMSVSTIDGSLIFTTRQPLAVLFERYTNENKITV